MGTEQPINSSYKENASTEVAAAFDCKQRQRLLELDAKISQTGGKSERPLQNKYEPPKCTWVHEPPHLDAAAQSIIMFLAGEPPGCEAAASGCT